MAVLPRFLALVGMVGMAKVIAMEGVRLRTARPVPRLARAGRAGCRIWTRPWRGCFNEKKHCVNSQRYGSRPSSLFFAWLVMSSVCALCIFPIVRIILCITPLLSSFGQAAAKAKQSQLSMEERIEAVLADESEVQAMISGLDNPYAEDDDDGKKPYGLPSSPRNLWQ